VAENKSKDSEGQILIHLKLNLNQSVIMSRLRCNNFIIKHVAYEMIIRFR